MKKLGIMILTMAMPMFLAGATLAQEQVKPGALQQLCFIMKGNPVNAKIFTDYKGHRIYFCCRDCQAQFEQNPEKYLQAMMEANFPLEKTPAGK